MISVKNHHITAIVRVDIDLESEHLEIKTSCQMLWGGIVSKYSNCDLRQVFASKGFG